MKRGGEVKECREYIYIYNVCVARAGGRASGAMLGGRALHDAKQFDVRLATQVCTLAHVSKTQRYKCINPSNTTTELAVPLVEVVRPNPLSFVKYQRFSVPPCLVDVALLLPTSHCSSSTVWAVFVILCIPMLFKIFLPPRVITTIITVIVFMLHLLAVPLAVPPSAATILFVSNRGGAGQHALLAWPVEQPWQFFGALSKPHGGRAMTIGSQSHTCITVIPLLIATTLV